MSTQSKVHSATYQAIAMLCLHNKLQKRTQNKENTITNHTVLWSSPKWTTQNLGEIPFHLLLRNTLLSCELLTLTISTDCNQGTNIKLFLELCCSKAWYLFYYLRLTAKALVIKCTSLTPIVLQVLKQTSLLKPYPHPPKSLPTPSPELLGLVLRLVHLHCSFSSCFPLFLFYLPFHLCFPLPVCLFPLLIRLC